MFKQIKYKVYIKTADSVESHKVTRLDFNDIGVEKAHFSKDDKQYNVMVDWDSVFISEFLNNFDRNGIEVYSGDIVEYGESKDKYFVSVVQGSACLMSTVLEKVISLNIETSKDFTVVGNVYTTPIEDRQIDETVFENKDEQTKE